MNKGHCENCLNNLVNHRLIDDLYAEIASKEEMMMEQFAFIKRLEQHPDHQVRDAIKKVRYEFESKLS